MNTPGSVCVVRLRSTSVAGSSAARHAEVEDLDAPVVRDEHVLGLQIAMDDPAIVCGREPERQLHRPLERLARRRRAALEPLAKRLPFEQLHDRMRDAAVGADVVERQDVGMVDGRDRARFALESRQRIRVAGERAAEAL